MEIKVGDKVLLQLGVDYKYAPKGLQRWDGCQFVVAKMHFVIGGRTYELKSCNAPNGLPYTIAEDWLTPIR